MCPADPAPSAESGLPTGQPSVGPEPEGFLILRVKGVLSQTMYEQARESLAPIGKKMNLQVMVVDEGSEVDVRYNHDPLVAAIRDQITAINRLAESNQALVQAIAEGDGMDDMAPTTYMDGSPVR